MSRVWKTELAACTRQIPSGQPCRRDRRRRSDRHSSGGKDAGQQQKGHVQDAHRRLSSRGARPTAVAARVPSRSQRDGRQMNAVARLAGPDPMRATTTETRCEPRSRMRDRTASGSTSTPRTRISTAPTSRAGKAPGAWRRSRACRAPRNRAPRRSPGHRTGRRCPGRGCHQSVPGGVVTDQARAHHRPVGVDDPPPAPPGSRRVPHR